MVRERPAPEAAVTVISSGHDPKQEPTGLFAASNSSAMTRSVAAPARGGAGDGAAPPTNEPKTHRSACRVLASASTSQTVPRLVPGSFSSIRGNPPTRFGNEPFTCNTEPPPKPTATELVPVQTRLNPALQFGLPMAVTYPAGGAELSARRRERAIATTCPLLAGFPSPVLPPLPPTTTRVPSSGRGSLTSPASLLHPAPP